MLYVYCLNHFGINVPLLLTTICKMAMFKMATVACLVLLCV